MPAKPGDIVLHDLKNRALFLADALPNDPKQKQSVRELACQILAFYKAARCLCAGAIREGELGPAVSQELAECIGEGETVATQIAESEEPDGVMLVQMANMLRGHYEGRTLVYQVVAGTMLCSDGDDSPVLRALRKVVLSLFPSSLLRRAKPHWGSRRGGKRELCLGVDGGEVVVSTGIAVDEMFTNGRVECSLQFLGS